MGFLIGFSIISNIIGIIITLVNFDYFGDTLFENVLKLCKECNIIGKIFILIFSIILFPVAIVAELLIKFIIWLFTVGKK